jgi:hypothetical protein
MVALELNWLGDESMQYLSCPAFQVDFIYEYASPALKVELRKLSRDDQSETDRLKQIVRAYGRLTGISTEKGRSQFRRQRMGAVIADAAPTIGAALSGNDP